MRQANSICTIVLVLKDDTGVLLSIEQAVKGMSFPLPHDCSGKGVLYLVRTFSHRPLLIIMKYTPIII